MNKLSKRLIELGVTNPELRKALCPILSHLEKTSSEEEWNMKDHLASALKTLIKSFPGYELTSSTLEGTLLNVARNSSEFTTRIKISGKAGNLAITLETFTAPRETEGVKKLNEGFTIISAPLMYPVRDGEAVLVRQLKKEIEKMIAKSDRVTRFYKG